MQQTTTTAKNEANSIIERYQYKVEGDLRYYESDKVRADVRKIGEKYRVVSGEPQLIDPGKSIYQNFISYLTKLELVNFLEETMFYYATRGLRRKIIKIEKIQGASVTAKALLDYEEKHYPGLRAQAEKLAA